MAYNVDPFGHQQHLQGLYTQLCFCFPSEGLSCAHVIRSLEHGIERLIELVPWVAGNTVMRGNGSVEIEVTNEIPLEIKMACKPVFPELKKADFPSRWLDEDWIAPCSTISSEHSAVLLIRINFIPNGLLLVFCAQHNVMDMTGMAVILRILDKLCRDEEPDPDDIRVANTLGKVHIDLLDEPSELLKTECFPSPVANQQQPDSSTRVNKNRNNDIAWCSFSIPDVDSLKAAANVELDSTEESRIPAPFVSTDDITSAFLFKAIALARQQSRNWPLSQELIMIRAIDPRRFLGIPANYPGVISNKIYTKFTVDELLNLPLSQIARRLRKSLEDEQSLVRSSKVLATLVARDDGEKFDASIDPTRDIVLSSWAFVDAYNWSFNIAAPTAVRRPRFTPVEGLAYIMPRKNQESSIVSICLSAEDRDALRSVPIFRDNALYIG